MINKPFIRNQNRPVRHSENWTRLESVLRSNSSILLSQNCIQIFALRAGGGRHHDCPRFRLSSDTTWSFHTERIFCPLSDVHIFLCLSLWYSPSNVACTSLFQDTAPCLVSPPLSPPSPLPPSLQQQPGPSPSKTTLGWPRRGFAVLTEGLGGTAIWRHSQPPTLPTLQTCRQWKIEN